MKKIALSLVLALTVSLASVQAYAAVKPCNEKCTHDKNKKCDNSCSKNKKTAKAKGAKKTPMANNACKDEKPKNCTATAAPKQGSSEVKTTEKKAE